MTTFIVALLYASAFFGAGWYAKGKLGTKVAAEAVTVQTAAIDVAADIKKL